MKQILKQLNFSNKEASVYLAALAMGNGSVAELSKRSKIKRPTTYVVLEKLKEMSLISLSEKGGKQIFASLGPEKLLNHIEQEKKVLIENEIELKRELPKLQALGKKDSAVPLIKYYEGKNNVWNMISDMVESRQISWIIVPGKYFDIYGKEKMMNRIIRRRSQIGNKAFMISDHHPEEIKLWKRDETDIREYRFLPELKQLEVSIYLYGNKVALLFLTEPYNGLLIENKGLFDVFKFMFDSLWKELEGKNLPEKKPPLIV